MVWKASLTKANIHQLMRANKQVPACRMGAQVRPGKAQRYGPNRVVLLEYGRLGLAARPAVW